MSDCILPTHEGWTNFPTWCVNLTISNTEAYYNSILGMAKRIPDLFDLADRIKAFVEELRPLESGDMMWRDLSQWAFDHVCWREIAREFLTTIKEIEEGTSDA